MTHLRSPLPTFGKIALFAAAAAGALWLAAQPERSAADKSDPPKADAAPLDFVPADAVAVLSVRVADYWDHPLNKAARDAVGKGLANAFDAFHKQFGVAPDDVDRLTLFVPGASQIVQEPLIALTTVKPYDRKAVLDAVAPGAKEEKINDRSYYHNERGQSVTFPDDHTFVMAFISPDGVAAYLKRTEGKKDGPLAAVLKMAGEKHYLVAGVDPAALEELPPISISQRLPPDLKAFKSLLKAQLATLTVDLDEQLRADLKVTFASEADAKEGMAALNDALDMARAGLVQGIKELNRLGDAPKSTAVLKDVQAALRAAKAEQKGATVEVAVAMKIDPESTAAALTEAVEKVRAAARRIEISNDLKQLTLGAINYADSHDGRMLPAAVYDKNGKPLLSWRVLVLPYIEQNELYKEFHLDEPWDSDHNKKLLEKMPPTFAPADSEAFKKHETFFQGFVGAGSVFDGGDLRFPASIPDGTSQTIMFAEAAKSVPWTKPDDIPFDAGKLAPRLGGLSKDGFMVSLCDGSVRFLSRAVSEETLRAIVTRDAGDIPGADLDK